ncbi:transposase [Methanosarcina sp. WWM596]|uniref:RNA-guided endonuclease InsQ/TnpB family protein n=1 Tax=Methanosarcina sp. WWM596 TaxID=1434103 RepID=UPI0006158298|nr:transposase [Methanosarcina sp. WWM596]AKB17514.1 Transposase-like protein B [Methanosarcina sp. WWM596]
MWTTRANMHLTKKIKINPTEEQIDVLWQLSEQCRCLYNFALAERKNSWETEQRTVKYVEQQNHLPALKESFSHKANEIPLSFEVGNVCDLLAIKQVEIYNYDPYKGRGNFVVSITYDENPISPITEYVDNDLYQAIDLGITKIVTAVNTQGKFFEVKTPRSDQYWNTKIDTIKSRKDHCKKGSNRWNRLHKTYIKMEAKKSNQIKDFQHKLSKTMIENTRANTIIVGDLNVKKMAQSKKVTGKRKRPQNRITDGYLHHCKYPGDVITRKKLLPRFHQKAGRGSSHTPSKYIIIDTTCTLLYPAWVYEGWEFLCFFL